MPAVVAVTADASLLGGYLRARRAAVSPSDAGLPADDRRRVKGLRRAEVAQLAGISTEYYVRLEQGREHVPSAQVIAALARALRLDADGAAYLRAVAERAPASEAPGSGRRPSDEELRRLVRRWDGTPVFVADRNLDIVASNALCDAIGGGVLSPGQSRVEYVFSEACRAKYPAEEWQARAAQIVAVFRFSADPGDERMHEVLGGLMARSPDFAELWGRYDVAILTNGAFVQDVPPFGRLDFEWELLVVPGTDGLTITPLFPSTPESAAAVAFLDAQGGAGRLPA